MSDQDPIDREFNELLAQGAAREQMVASALADSMAKTAKLLGDFRSALLHEGFSEQGAEELARDYYQELLAFASAELCDEDD